MKLRLLLFLGLACLAVAAPRRGFEREARVRLEALARAAGLTVPLKQTELRIDKTRHARGHRPVTFLQGGFEGA